MILDIYIACFGYDVVLEGVRRRFWSPSLTRISRIAGSWRGAQSIEDRMRTRIHGIIL